MTGVFKARGVGPGPRPRQHTVSSARQRPERLVHKPRTPGAHLGWHSPLLPSFGREGAGLDLDLLASRASAQRLRPGESCAAPPSTVPSPGCRRWLDHGRHRGWRGSNGPSPPSLRKTSWEKMQVHSAPASVLSGHLALAFEPTSSLEHRCAQGGDSGGCSFRA